MKLILLLFLLVWGYNNERKRHFRPMENNDPRIKEITIIKTAV